MDKSELDDIKWFAMARAFKDYINETHGGIGGHFDCDTCSMYSELITIVQLNKGNE